MFSEFNETIFQVLGSRIRIEKVRERRSQQTDLLEGGLQVGFDFLSDLDLELSLAVIFVRVIDRVEFRDVDGFVFGVFENRVWDFFQAASDIGDITGQAALGVRDFGVAGRLGDDLFDFGELCIDRTELNSGGRFQIDELVGSQSAQSEPHVRFVELSEEFESLDTSESYDQTGWQQDAADDQEGREGSGQMSASFGFLEHPAMQRLKNDDQYHGDEDGYKEPDHHFVEQDPDQGQDR